jgi:hypothetical protein
LEEKRVSLYQRIPEIYKIKDLEQEPPGQFKEYLGLVEDIFDKIHSDIENLYHNLFIDTCDGWVIPYIGDLLGRSHLAGDIWTLRADVSDTVLLRKYKGTLLAIERLTYDLTQWGVHCVELRENLLWHQHLNHLRPDIQANGYSPITTSTNGAVRGGTVNLRDPALLSLLKSPFDEFAYTPDFKADSFGAIRYNLPNLAIFIWTLRAYQIKASQPILVEAINPNPSPTGDEAPFIVRVTVNPTGEPIILFNSHRFNFESREVLLPLETVTEVDKTPNPIPKARLCESSPAGNPDEYVELNSFDASILTSPIEISRIGLQLHFPVSDFSTPDDFTNWSIRGENLCAWEEGLAPTLKKNEIAIDPRIGRIVIGIDTTDRQQAIIRDLLVTFTYGAVGPVGAHPTLRTELPSEWRVPGQSIVDFREVVKTSPNSLELALDNIQNSLVPVVIEIKDSKIYTLDITQIQGTIVENGVHSLRLNNLLIIRAADDQRPVIKLVNPLRFRPTNVKGSNTDEQEEFDNIMAKTTVVLEGLYITRDSNFPTGQALITRAAINSLELVGCTLDPGGHMMLNANRAPILSSLDLKIPFDFSDPGEENAFSQVPRVLFERTISGPIFIDKDYQLLRLINSIVDAGSGVDSDPVLARFSVSGSSSDPANSWSAPVDVHGLTAFGRMRSQRVDGVSTGGIWVHTVEIQDNQSGCIKFSYFSGKGDDRLPMHFGCVFGNTAKLLFESEIFWNPAYAQLSRMSDFRIRERGPNNDAMGAFGFLLEAHKWRNLSIRYREFMPVGLRPLIIKVT